MECKYWINLNKSGESGGSSEGIENEDRRGDKGKEAVAVMILSTRAK